MYGYWLLRGIAIVLAGIGVPLVLGGVAMRLPLQERATQMAGIDGVKRNAPGAEAETEG